MAPEVYRAVIDEAHKRGLRVAVHLFYLADAKGVLDAGADFIAHSVRDADVDADVDRHAEGARHLPVPDADARSVDVRLRVDAGVLLRSAVPEVLGPAVDQPAEGPGVPGEDGEGSDRRSATRRRSRSPAAT